MNTLGIFKSRNRWLITLVGAYLALISHFAMAVPSTGILLLRGSSSDPIQSPASFNMGNSGAAQLIESDALEFANGNTFVKIKKSVAGSKVYLLIPAALTADQLVEALIKVRTAKYLGATDIVVLVNGNPQGLTARRLDGRAFTLDLKTLFSVAGANLMVGPGNDPVSIGRLGLTRKMHLLDLGEASQRSERRRVVMSDNHRELALSVGHELALPVVPDTDPAGSREVILFGAPAAPVNENLLNSLEKIQNLTDAGDTVHFVSPYLPYARSDKAEPGVAAIGRLWADLIENAGAKTVTVVTAHAPQSVGFFSVPCYDTESFKTIRQEVEKLNIDLVVAPDAGAQKAATVFADGLELPVGVINKQRELKQIKVRGISLPSSLSSLNGKRVMILDDETLTGSTLKEAAELVKSMGASFVAVGVTHLPGDASKALKSQSIDRVIVTDSIPIPSEIARNPKLVVLSLAHELAESISENLGLK